MKKIKNIRQLTKERKRLLQREKELMGQIGSGWEELKNDLRPRSLAGEQLKKCCGPGNGKSKDENIFKSTLSVAVSLLARKLAKRAEEKIDKFFD